ncbi:hypothetical protein [Pseudomonas zeae]|uniref:Uncharacterized protein n=1 Tax=Pseudomonas zeae TaxID=2745510 RepID=A0ABU5BSM2_9PSED|nr:hypothetical protein [Pseudomonas zeae]MDX9679698.1 hypothetical protein [Pseudomonas zeae]
MQVLTGQWWPTPLFNRFAFSLLIIELIVLGIARLWAVRSFAD